jgi:hypothetical protein
MALISTKNILVAINALVAVGVQFAGYGYGFLKSTILINVLDKKPERQFPNLFFKSK